MLSFLTKVNRSNVQRQVVPAAIKASKDLPLTHHSQVEDDQILVVSPSEPTQ